MEPRPRPPGMAIGGGIIVGGIPNDDVMVMSPWPAVTIGCAEGCGERREDVTRVADKPGGGVAGGTVVTVERAPRAGVDAVTATRGSTPTAAAAAAADGVPSGLRK